LLLPWLKVAEPVLLDSYHLNADRRRTLATVFDALYAVFGVVIVVVLVVTVVIGVRRSDAGAAIAAIGVSLVLVAGVGFNALLRSGQITDLAFLQIHFPVFHLGFALILAGADRVLGVRRRIGWLLYVLAYVAAAVYLLTPSLASYATTGDTVRVSQQVIFYLPLFVGIALIAIASYRARSWALEAFALARAGWRRSRVGCNTVIRRRLPGSARCVRTVHPGSSLLGCTRVVSGAVEVSPARHVG
jgi:hypothetical protein